MMKKAFTRLLALVTLASAFAVPAQARELVYGNFDQYGRFSGFSTADGGNSFRGNVLPKRQWLTKSFGGRYSTVANAADHTSKYEFTFETEPGAVRICVLNNTAAALTNVKAHFQFAQASGTIRNSTTLAALNAASKYQFLWSGSTTATIAAGSATHTVDNPNATCSDTVIVTPPSPLRTDGGTLSMGVITVEVPAANTTLPIYYFNDLGELENDGDAATAPYGRFVRMSTQAVLGSTTPANFTSTTTNGNAIPILVQYIPKRPVKGATLAVFGDSMLEGVKSGATGRRAGVMGRVQNLVSSSERPLEICNLAIHGAAASRFNDRVTTLIPVVLPEIAFYPLGTVNSATQGGSSAQAASDVMGMRGQKHLSQAVFNNYDVFVAWTTWPPSNNVARNIVEADKLRLVYNAELMNATPSNREGRVDFAAALTGPVDGNGQTTIPAALTSDNVHESDAGADAEALQAVPLVKQLLNSL